AALDKALMTQPVNFVLDVDIRTFFDSVDHGWLMRMLAHRIADPRVLRLIERWLEAGVLESGQWRAVEAGTPQGSGISPVLANVFLHYVVDLWVRQWRGRRAVGQVIVCRYADDMVLGCQYEADGKQLLADLKDRLEQFGLSLHEGKTRLIEFGRFAARNRAAAGPSTFWASRTIAARPERTSSWSFLQNGLSEVDYSWAGRGEPGCVRSGRGGPVVDDANDLIDGERDDAEHEMAFDLERAADAEKSGAELVFQTGVDAFGHGAEIVDQVVEVGHVDELQALDFAAPFGLALVVGAKVAVDDGGVAERPALVVDRGGVVGGVHEIVEIGDAGAGHGH